MPKPSQSQQQVRELALVTRWSWSAVAVLAAVLAVVSWVAWPGPPPEPELRARQYRDYDMCLLTGKRGIAGTEAAKVYAGMEELSLQTKVRLSFMAVRGDQSQERAEQFVATQVQQQCGIIVAVGEHQVAAVAALAGRHPQVHFVAVGGTSSAGNLTNVDPGGVADHLRPLIPESTPR